MKTRRIASSLALAAAVALGASGCGLMVPQATTHIYAPSDGVDATVEDIAVRNLMLVADESGKHFNVVFTAVNNGTKPAVMGMTIVNEEGSDQASVDFQLKTGVNKFGDPKGDNPVTVIALKGAEAGGAVDVFIEVAGGGEYEINVPVIDGSGDLTEYADYVISSKQLAQLEAEDAKKNEQADDAENKAEGEESAAG